MSMGLKIKLKDTTITCVVFKSYIDLLHAHVLDWFDSACQPSTSRDWSLGLLKVG